MKHLYLLPFIIFGLTANATNYYFSIASGDDSRTAAQAQNPVTPWKTLNKLNSFFGSLKPGDSVLLNRGDVFYGSITINKSGVSGSPIVIGAYGTGAKPVIAGFTTVSTWTNLGGNIWESTSAVSTLSTLNMVVINGVNTAMGRYPNSGYLTYQSHVGNTSITSSSLNSATTNWTGAEAVIRKTAWITDRNPITAHSGGTLTYSGGDNNATATDNYGFYIQNDSRTLDAANEWYYNPSTKKIRVYSTVSPTNVQVASISELVYMLTKSYTTFDNLSFQGSNDKTFTILSSPNITIQNCNIDYSGQDAIFGNKNWGSPSSNFVIKNSTINHTNNNAIHLALEFTGALISNNSILNTGINDGMGGYGTDTKLVAIMIRGASTIIENNIIENVGYSGVIFEDNNVIIRNNLISNFCTQKIDGAGIYSWYGTSGFSTYTGQKIYNNIVLNGIGSTAGTTQSSSIVFGIYLDDGIANVEVYGNTCANNAHSGLYLHNTSNINVHDNTFYNNGENQQLITSYLSAYPTKDLTIKNNIFFSRTAKQKTADWQTLVDNLTSFGTATSIDNNYYARPIDDNLTIKTEVNDGTVTQRTLAGWKTYSGFDVNSGKSPKTITDVNDLRFEYNATSSPVVVTLPSNYMDVRGATYNGTITLAPYSSAVLIKNGAIMNQAPKANAGPDQNIILPSDSITLSGSGTDPDGSISSYLWTKIAGPATYKISKSNSDSTAVIELVEGEYKFELKVTDNNGAVGKDTILVTVNAAAITHVANAGFGSSITLPVITTSMSGTGSDADGKIAGYAWSPASGQQLFSGRTRSATTTLNNLLQGNYTFRLQGSFQYLPL